MFIVIYVPRRTTLRSGTAAGTIMSFYFRVVKVEKEYGKAASVVPFCLFGVAAIFRSRVPPF